MAARSRSNSTHLLDDAGRAAECPVASAGKSQCDPSSVSIVSRPSCGAQRRSCAAARMVPRLAGAFRPGPEAVRGDTDCVTPSRCAGGCGVFERRRAVALALALHFSETEGLSIAQIAERIGRSPATIKAYFYDPSDANKGPSWEREAEPGGREFRSHPPAAASRGDVLPRRTLFCARLAVQHRGQHDVDFSCHQGDLCGNQ